MAEDDEGHASLIEKSLKKAGIKKEIIHFRDGQSLLDYLYTCKNEIAKNKISPLLLLDIRMPQVNGLEVMKIIKHDEILQNMQIIVITTTDDPFEIIKCYKYGCNIYITKPIVYEKFQKTFYNLGRYLLNMRSPYLNTTK